MKTYCVTRVDQPVAVNAVWEKSPWDEIGDLMLGEYMGDRPVHFPGVQVKLAYDVEVLSVIFRVADRYVCARKKAYQDRVCEDSCVEFFFTPGEERSQGYFNLELNCGGTAYFHHQRGRGSNDIGVDREDFEQIEIAHSMPKIIDPEIVAETPWVVEYRLPFRLLENYAPLVYPATGVVWLANFYKCADESSHPHWLTWSQVDLPTPEFHQPAFFGRLVFE